VGATASDEAGAGKRPAEAEPRLPHGAPKLIATAPGTVRCLGWQGVPRAAKELLGAVVTALSTLEASLEQKHGVYTVRVWPGAEQDALPLCPLPPDDGGTATSSDVADSSATPGEPMAAESLGEPVAEESLDGQPADPILTFTVAVRAASNPRCSDLHVRRISGSALIMKGVYEQFRDALSHSLKLRDYSELARFSVLHPP